MKAPAKISAATWKAASTPGSRPWITFARAAPRNNAIYLVGGMWERDAGNAVCTVLFFAPTEPAWVNIERSCPQVQSAGLGIRRGAQLLPVYETELGQSPGARSSALGKLSAFAARCYVRKGIESTARLPGRARIFPVATVRPLASGRALLCLLVQSIPIVEAISPPTIVFFIYGEKSRRNRRAAVAACPCPTRLEIFLPDQTRSEAILVAEVARHNCARQIRFGRLGHYARSRLSNFTLTNAQRTQSS